jgi:hypothetical protein
MTEAFVIYPSFASVVGVKALRMGSQMSATRKLAAFTHDSSYSDISVTVDRVGRLCYYS